MYVNGQGVVPGGYVLNSLDSIWMWGDAITAKEMAHPSNLFHFELKFPGV